MIGGPEGTEHLAAAALAGDDDALGRLLTAHQPAAYAAAFRLLGSEADAADAVQEALLLAVRAIRGEGARPRGAQHFGAWLRRIVTNTALQRLRRRPRLSAVSLTDLVDELPAHNAREPAEEAERREVRGDVLRALLALPDPQRAALTLREFEELSYEEIAEALGTSRLAVQMLLFRARRNFRAAYEGLTTHRSVVGCVELAPLLSALLDGELGSKAWLKLSLHLAHCTRCRSELAELRKTRRLSAQMPLVPLPAHWSWTAPPGADGLIEAGGLAAATPGLEGALQFGTLARAAALAIVGVTLATSTPPEDRSPLAAGPPHEVAGADGGTVFTSEAAGASPAPTGFELVRSSVPEARDRILDPPGASVLDSGGSPVTADSDPASTAPGPPAVGALTTAALPTGAEATERDPILQTGSGLARAAAPAREAAVQTAQRTSEASVFHLLPEAPIELSASAAGTVQPVADALTSVPAAVPGTVPAGFQPATPIATVVGQSATVIPTVVAVAETTIPALGAGAPTLQPTATRTPGPPIAVQPALPPIATPTMTPGGPAPLPQLPVLRPSSPVRL